LAIVYRAILFCEKMAEAVGLASGIAQLVVIAVQITQLSYGYVSDVRNASRTQKTYLQEVSALTDVLFRLEEAIQESEAAGALDNRPQSLSHKALSECHQQLALQRSKLEKHIARLIWPFQDRELKKAIDDLHRFRSIFADYITANIASVSAT
jgi:Fungal N-terminal domain of STAND proteins